MYFKKILVTGAAGFIGFYQCKRLLDEGFEVVGLDNINNYYSVQLKYDRLKELGINQKEAERWNFDVISSKYPNFKFIRTNLEDRENLPKLFKEENFDAVIHLAAQAGVRYSLENPETYIDSNIVGFLNILEACRHNHIKHMVYASSSSVYGANAKIPFSEEDRVDEPVSLYAATKKSNELMAYTYAHLYKIPCSGLRFFTVYGPWGRPDMAPILFASAIAENRPIKVFNHGEMYRDFTYIDDIINGILITLNHPPCGLSEVEAQAENNRQQTIPHDAGSRLGRDRQLEQSKTTPKAWQAPHQLFNIGNGSSVHLMEFIQTLEKEMGTSAEKIMMEMQPGDVPRTWADTTKLNKLGYKSITDIKKGVKEFVRWFKDYKLS